jgi:Fic family protein
MGMFENKIDKCDEQKKEIDSHRPLSSEQSKQLKDHFKIGLTYSSNALEGNTLTLIETKVIIEDGLTIGGKSLTEIDEATGHARAYDFIFELVKNETISLKDILKIHKLFYQNIDPDNAGTYRTKKVFISGMDVTLPEPGKIASLMDQFEKEITVLKVKLHPIAYAATLHNKFVTIHPFMDGNGRTARLLMNLLLVKAGYSITIIPPIFRADYISCAYQGNLGKDEPFIQMLSCMVYESQKEYLRLLGA